MPLNVGERLVHGVIGADQEIDADCRELICGREHQFTRAPPVATIDAIHVIGERVCVHRNLGMIVGPEKLRAFYTNGPITKSCAFGGAGNNPDVLRHDLTLPSPLDSTQIAPEIFHNARCEALR